MSKELDTKIWLTLDKVEHQIRRAAYLATAEEYQKKIYDALDIIKEVKEEVEKKLDKPKPKGYNI
tara:strand:+ start:5692 stop:5886 length:195 start_codon:yes stop_codon:yes gene_type:complete